MRNGLYKVSFRTPIGFGDGVAYVHDGKLHGGDSMMAYTGSFSENGGQLSAQVTSRRHSVTPGLTSVFGGVDSVTIALTGTANGDKSAKFKGTAAQAPGVPFEAEMQHLND